MLTLIMTGGQILHCFSKNCYKKLTAELSGTFRESAKKYFYWLVIKKGGGKGLATKKKLLFLNI